MKNNITELVFILDRSGSMSGLESDTIGGFNSTIARQKELDGTCYVTTVLFDHEQTTLHDRIPLDKVQPLTGRDYCVRGSTALLDAVGSTISHIAAIHHYARPEDVPENTIFVIITDGMENASSRYGAEEVRRKIRHEQEKYGWEFLFLGANIDAVQTAAHIGIRADRSANYRPDSCGTAAVYESACEAVLNKRQKKSMAHWSDAVDRDYNSRK